MLVALESSSAQPTVDFLPCLFQDGDLEIRCRDTSYRWRCPANLKTRIIEGGGIELDSLAMCGRGGVLSSGWIPAPSKEMAAKELTNMHREQQVWKARYTGIAKVS